MEYVLLLIGFVLLVKGADFFVEGSSSLAKILKVPSVIIGLTIVAMGTSAPEASVSINAALGGSNDIAISNVVGSNIFNGLVVVGICAFLSGFQTNAEILKRDMPVNILVTLILCLMFLDGTLGRVEGFLLLAGMVLYITCMIRSALRNREKGEVCKVLPLPKSILFMGGRTCRCHLRWRSGRRQRLHHRRKLWCQPEFYRIDHHRHRHLPAGTRHLDCGNQKRRQRSGARQRGRIESLQYPVYPRHGPLPSRRFTYSANL